MEQEVKKRGRPKKVVAQQETSSSSYDSSLSQEQAKQFTNAFFAKMKDEPYQVISNTISGYTVEQIENILSNPEGNQTQLISLSNYAYRAYAYFQQVVDYYSNMPLFRPDYDTVVRDSAAFYRVNKKQLQKNYSNFIDIIYKMHFEWIINDIFKLLLIEDTVYGFWLEIDTANILYLLPSSWCSIRKKIGNNYLYGINTRGVPRSDIEKLPEPIAKLIQSGKQDKDGYVYPESVDSFLLKWNSHIPYNYPPLFSLIEPILNIKDHQDLEKGKAEQENYSLLSYEIPLADGQNDTLKLTDKTVAPFINMTKNIVPKSIGVTVAPLKVTPVSFKDGSTSDKNRVNNAVDNFYKEAGISPAIMSGATSGSEVKLGLLNDQMAIWKIYRQLESVISLHMDLLKVGTYPSYKFEFKMLDITQFNKSDFVKEYTSLAQVSYPVKTVLGSAMGKSINALLGNSYMENYVLGMNDMPLGSDWNILKSSHTASTSNNSGGRPSSESKGKDLTPSGEQTQDGDQNNPDNRI